MTENQLFYSVHWQIKQKGQDSRYWKRLSNYPLRVLERYDGYARQFQRWIWEHGKCERELRWEHIGQHMGLCSGAQSCPILCNPMGWSPTGSSVPGIFQARILEWDAILFSRGSSWPGINPGYMSPALAGRFFTSSANCKPHMVLILLFWESSVTLRYALAILGADQTCNGKFYNKCTREKKESKDFSVEQIVEYFSPLFISKKPLILTSFLLTSN